MAKIKEELACVQSSILKDTRTNKTFLMPSGLTDIQQKIYHALGIKYDARVKELG